MEQFFLTQISADPGLNFSPGFYISLFKSIFGLIFSIQFQIVGKRIDVDFCLKLSDLK